MSEQCATSLLTAIKTDDVKAFAQIVCSNKECFSFCYGRFPTLSLCYLYHSKKITKAFSAPMKKATNYIVLAEDSESYRKFKDISKKALRLYVYGNAVVSPLEMLAVLDEKLFLEAEFPTTRKTLAESSNIKTVYSILHNREAAIDGDRIKIKKRKLPSALQLLVVLLLVCFASAAMVFSGIATNSVSNHFGQGTESSPTKIMNGKQMSISLKTGDLNYTLENDIIFTDAPESFSLSGVLDGKGHTVYLKGNGSSGIFGALSGTLKNINFVFENLNITLNQNFALLALKNTGQLENIHIKVDGTFTKSPAIASVTYFLSCGVSENYGSIRGLTLDADITYRSSGNGDAFLAGIANANYATISDCATTENSRFIGETVDVSALVTENGKDGKISNCINNAYVFQKSEQTDWSPNVGGIALTNFGIIQNSKNYGKLEIFFQAQTNSNAFIAGIAVTNDGNVVSCQNFGELAFALKTQAGSESYIGGIVSVNNANVTFSQNSGRIAVRMEGSTLTTAASVFYAGGIVATNNKTNASVDNSSNDGKLTLYAKGNSTFFGGGIVAKNFGTATNCRNTAEIIGIYDDTMETSVCLGGICAQNLNQLTKNKNSGNITASTKSESTSVFALLVGGIVGYNIPGMTTLAKVDSCISIAEIKLTSTAPDTAIPYVFGGGIAGANYGAIFGSISDTTFVVNCSASGVAKLFVGGIAAFMEKGKSNNIGSNYFVGKTLTGIASLFSVEDGSMIFGAPSNEGCTEKERSQLKDLEEYWE